MRRAEALTRSMSLEAKSVESSLEINIGANHKGYEREDAFDKSGEDHGDVKEDKKDVEGVEKHVVIDEDKNVAINEDGDDSIDEFSLDDYEDDDDNDDDLWERNSEDDKAKGP